jgi:hypothetical protein|tara:strand:- start:121 stop:363 length:243 start_codon:yes stop_codon:yes gene_type:complete
MLKEEQVKIGNLVRLSYYGTKMKSNPMWMNGTKGKALLGVITNLQSGVGVRYPICVKWFHENAPDGHNLHGRRELKIARG